MEECHIDVRWWLHEERWTSIPIPANILLFTDASQTYWGAYLQDLMVARILFH